MAQDTQVTKLHSIVQLQTLEIAGGEGRESRIDFDLHRIILLNFAFAMAIELNVLAAVGKCVFFLSSVILKPLLLVLVLL